MNTIPQIHKLSRASQLSLLAVVILMGAVFFTINNAMQQQESAGHATSATPTITYVQSNYKTSYNNSTPVTLTNSVTAGDFLVVAVSNYVGTVASISDNRGDTFQIAKQQPTVANTAVGQISIYYVKSAVGGSTTITATSTAPSSQTSVSLEAVEYSGINTSNPLDQVAGATGTSTAINSGNTPTTTQANELVFGAGTFTNNSKYTISAGSGFTYRGGNTDGTNYNPAVFVEDKNVYATGAYNAPFSSSANVAWQGSVVTFRAAAAPTVFVAPTAIPTLAPNPTSTPTPKPTATPVPTAIPTSKPGVTPTSTPILTPTTALTAAPTPTPIAAATATPAPTGIAATPLPTNTPIPGATQVNVTVGLQGIGNAGDSASPNSVGNTNPVHPSRTITMEVYDSSNTLVVSQTGTVQYDAATGKFEGTVNLGTSFQTGLYTIKIKSSQYLRSLVPGILTITQGQVVTLPPVLLVVGDINGDNAINILDYNILMGCYSDLLPATNCTAANNVLADLNDDGAVNQIDYNLFLRELTNIGGQ